MVGVLKLENKPLRIRWYLSDSLYTTGIAPVCLGEWATVHRFCEGE